MVSTSQARPHVLSPEALAQELARLPGWSADGAGLSRAFHFADFPAAIAFLMAAAVEAERLDHHPDWRNVYDRVEVRLVTHETADGAPGITELDLELARCMDEVAAGLRSAGDPEEKR